MFYKAKFSLCFEIHRVEILVVLNVVVRRVTARPWSDQCSNICL